MPRGVYKRKKRLSEAQRAERSTIPHKSLKPHVPAKKDLIRAYLNSLEYDLHHLVAHVESLKKLLD
jgi:hypothetical protein